MFRFSIRELMLVTLVVGLAVGWLCHWNSLEMAMKKELREQNASHTQRYDARTTYIENLKDSLRVEMAMRKDYEKRLGPDFGGGVFTYGDLPPELEKEPVPPVGQP